MIVTIHHSPYSATQGELVRWTQTGAVLRINGKLYEVHGQSTPRADTNRALQFSQAMALSGVMLE